MIYSIINSTDIINNLLRKYKINIIQSQSYPEEIKKEYGINIRVLCIINNNLDKKIYYSYLNTNLFDVLFIRPNENKKLTINLLNNFFGSNIPNYEYKILSKNYKKIDNVNKYKLNTPFYKQIFCLYDHNKTNNNIIISFTGQIDKSRRGKKIFVFQNIFKNEDFSNKYNTDICYLYDNNLSWYLNGLSSNISNINETINYLKNIIDNYDNIIFTGTSAGGFAALLYGNILNVNTVLSFIPQTNIENYVPKNLKKNKYYNLSKYINNKTQNFIYGNKDAPPNDWHNIKQYENIKDYKNVTIILEQGKFLKEYIINNKFIDIFRNFISKKIQ